MNAVALTGTIADLRVQDVGNEPRAMLVVAVESAGDATVELIPVSARGRPAEACARFLRRGMRVAVEGSVRARSTANADAPAGVEIVAASVHFIGGTGRRPERARDEEAPMAS